MCTYISCTYISIGTYISMVWGTFLYWTACFHISPSVDNVSNSIYTGICFLSFYPLCLLYSPRVFINKFVLIISRTSRISCRVGPHVRGRSLPSLNLVHLLIIVVFIATCTQYLVCLIPASKNLLKFNKKNTKDFIQKRHQSKIAVGLIPLFVIECLYYKP